MNIQERALLKMDEILSLVRKRMKDENGYDEHLLYSLAMQLVMADERIEALEEQIKSIERRMP